MNVCSCSRGDISGRYGLLLAGGRALVCYWFTLLGVKWSVGQVERPLQKEGHGSDQFFYFFSFVLGSRNPGICLRLE